MEGEVVLRIMLWRLRQLPRLIWGAYSCHRLQGLLQGVVSPVHDHELTGGNAPPPKSSPRRSVSAPLAPSSRVFRRIGIPRPSYTKNEPAFLVLPGRSVLRRLLSKRLTRVHVSSLTSLRFSAMVTIRIEDCLPAIVRERGPQSMVQKALRFM